jgi:hypothetical protein
LQRIYRVQVDAGRDRSRFMAERARHGLKVDPRRQRERPERVAQIVEAHVREFRSFNESGKRE